MVKLYIQFNFLLGFCPKSEKDYSQLRKNNLTIIIYIKYNTEEDLNKSNFISNLKVITIELKSEELKSKFK